MKRKKYGFFLCCCACVSVYITRVNEWKIRRRCMRVFERVDLKHTAWSIRWEDVEMHIIKHNLLEEAMWERMLTTNKKCFWALKPYSIIINHYLFSKGSVRGSLSLFRDRADASVVTRSVCNLDVWLEQLGKRGFTGGCRGGAMAIYYEQNSWIITPSKTTITITFAFLFFLFRAATNNYLDNQLIDWLLKWWID